MRRILLCAAHLFASTKSAIGAPAVKVGEPFSNGIRRPLWQGRNRQIRGFWWGHRRTVL